ncbi:TetR/AcrR family transcriptional regulator [Pyxidicoccus fallax]|uniref:TetR/AcrR family transcriptional regulator n=1 Tax=Pyxidicoccus fallax TaxID=394095 RepID=A0A848LEQ1_9BACT|nr:TetR/AcrR family transcriptional regulator [Pyxidicoccus fallax]NMO17217.1 TetR/AcrR family transcriptional regulator [Pyxidicoccus fallax]NPC79177.1 TetR/AcrR family transcriptional regulator [Pyxidicoccus fallax]
MAPDPTGAPRPGDDARRRKLLDAALTVFLRYGYRKTSMDEVARAAQVSRQGLYLHYATKEELFRATFQHTLEGALAAATAALGDSSLRLEARLVRAFDETTGRFVGMMGAAASDLVEVGSDIIGPLFTEFEGQFLEAVTRALRASGLMAAYKASGLTARQLADTLQATARGLKYGCTSREAFVERMTVAVRAMCAPLGEGS